MPTVYDLGSDFSRNLPNENVVMLRPGLNRAKAGRDYTLCDVVVLIERQSRRVYVGGGQYGYEGIAREIDNVGIETLAERFDSMSFGTCSRIDTPPASRSR